METWHVFIWGAAGSLLIEVLEFSKAVSRIRNWPWKSEGEPHLFPWLTALALRTAAASVVAFAAFNTQQISGIAGAIGVGAASLFIIEQMAHSIPSSAGVNLPVGENKESREAP